MNRFTSPVFNRSCIPSIVDLAVFRNCCIFNYRIFSPLPLLTTQFLLEINFLASVTKLCNHSLYLFFFFNRTQEEIVSKLFCLIHAYFLVIYLFIYYAYVLAFLHVFIRSIFFLNAIHFKFIYFLFEVV